MKQIVYITCGLVGSGKSTWAKHIAATEENFVIICRDNIRTMLKSSYIYDDNLEEVVMAIATCAVFKSLQENYNVIIDETNIKSSKRSFWLNIIANSEVHDIDPIIILFPETKNNLEYRMKDPRGYTENQWKEVIEGMKKKF